MWEAPIVKETRAAREELFARFNHDLAALCEYLREKEREHTVVWSRSSRAGLKLRRFRRNDVKMHA